MFLVVSAAVLSVIVASSLSLLSFKCKLFINFDASKMHFLPLQVSKISLVDLAGSERADSTGAKGTRLKVRLPSAQYFQILTSITLDGS